MFQICIVLLLISNLSAFPGIEDEVIVLPGLRFQPTFKHYSGYLNGSANRKLHYWFVESQTNPNIDPLVLWLNGGPGCSSVSGLIMENGPFHVTPESYLTFNPYSWNKIANVIYLESPSCVGFSYSIDGKCDASDDSTSLLNFNALQHFLVKFPQFKNRDFYVTGESYGGFYVPTLAARIVSTSPTLPVQFKGIAVGNGLSSYSINDNGNFHFAYNHGLISDSLWSEILSACCTGSNTNHCDVTGSSDPTCRDKVSQASQGFDNLNVYNIYSDCYTPSANKEIWAKLGVHSNYDQFQLISGWNVDPSHRMFKLRQQYKTIKSILNQLGLSKSKVMNIPCINETAPDNYLNSPLVRYALHIPSNVPRWSICSENANFHFHSNYENMSSQYETLFKLNNFKIWIYNGDVDMACCYLADEWFFEQFKQNVTSERKPWMYTDENHSSQVGGFVKVWDKFVLLTIRGSGHMVPTDKPLPAYLMFESFIKGIPL